MRQLLQQSEIIRVACQSWADAPIVATICDHSCRLSELGRCANCCDNLKPFVLPVRAGQMRQMLQQSEIIRVACQSWADAPIVATI